MKKMTKKNIKNGYVSACLLGVTTILFGALCIAYLVSGISGM